MCVHACVCVCVCVCVGVRVWVCACAWGGVCVKQSFVVIDVLTISFDMKL